jgi:hypothetical protein
VSTDHRLIDWILRIGIALQCAGYAWMVGWYGESPLMGWLWEPGDVGGLGLGESVATTIVRLVGALLAIAAVSTIVRPSRLVLAGVFVFQVVIAAAEWQTHDGFPLDVTALGDGVLRSAGDTFAPLFPFFASAARIVAPLVLLVVHWSKYRALLGIAITPLSEWLMRVGLSLTFAAHGVESMQQRGSFLDVLIMASRNLLGARLPESIAQNILLTIGIIDLVLAVLVVTRRWRAVVAYMAAWGMITAAARFVVLRWDTGWYEFAIRSSHWSLPLVLFLAWRVAIRPTTFREHESNRVSSV